MYWINQFRIECKLAPWSSMRGDLVGGWRVVISYSVIILSLSRHSIPVDANNILYFIHNKRSLLEKWNWNPGSSLFCIRFFSSLIPPAYVQKYFDDVIISCRIVCAWLVFFSCWIPLESDSLTAQNENNFVTKSNEGISEWCMKCWLFRWWCRCCCLSHEAYLECRAGAQSPQ